MHCMLHHFLKSIGLPMTKPQTTLQGVNHAIIAAPIKTHVLMNAANLVCLSRPQQYQEVCLYKCREGVSNLWTLDSKAIVQTVSTNVLMIRLKTIVCFESISFLKETKQKSAERYSFVNFMYIFRDETLSSQWLGNLTFKRSFHEGCQVWRQ